MSGQRQRARRRDERAERAQLKAAGVSQPLLLSAASRQQIAFDEFHRQHPDVYRAFERRALALYDRGYTHWGAAAIFEVLRYESAVSGQPDEAWRLNNSYRAYYARLFMTQHPELDGFFEVRQQRSA